MKTAIKSDITNIVEDNSINQNNSMQNIVEKSWTKIAPFWPLKNLVAVNPLQGFEDLPFEEAIIEGYAYFQQDDLPKPMHQVNRETIKWLQAFFDEGQATISMPLCKNGLYNSWQQIAKFDEQLHGKDIIKQRWLESLPQDSERAIVICLQYLQIPQQYWEQFLILMLTTLPGWAAHVKYRTDWSNSNSSYKNKVSKADYLAIRLATTCLLWPQAKILLKWHQEARLQALSKNSPMMNIETFENKYRRILLQSIVKQSQKEHSNPSAQLVFCIDVRSEPFRRSLENTGNYETYGFAGFFGVPIAIRDEVTGEEYNSCPVLLSPKYRLCKTENFANKAEAKKDVARYMVLKTIKRFYQSLKYNFTTPFALVETLGLGGGAWMAIRTFAPKIAYNLKTGISAKIRPLSSLPANYSTSDISFADKCSYAKSMLEVMGLTKDFAPLIVLCGHGSATQNNAYASALDCGACGGRSGKANACILAEILNDPNIRHVLSNNGIVIPESTHFIGAEHNTTTDEVILHTSLNIEALSKLKEDLKTAREVNSKRRVKEMGITKNIECVKHLESRSKDWAQVRPEWGLARNAAFIVAPRDLTKNIDLEGRVFLHSYDYKQDSDGSSLKSILTAPMVVAQWINTQYLFSTLDNVAYGGGSKITKNITGKLGIMQGNASDLMSGLPLQSVCATDSKAYHEPQRLMTVVYAPRDLIYNIVINEATLLKLFQNGWVKLACIEPKSQECYYLERNLTWRESKDFS